MFGRKEAGPILPNISRCAPLLFGGPFRIEFYLMNQKGIGEESGKGCMNSGDHPLDNKVVTPQRPF
jgi:hypothetical protein